MKRGLFLSVMALTLLLGSIPLMAYADGRRSDNRDVRGRDRYTDKRSPNARNHDWRCNDCQNNYRNGRDNWRDSRYDLQCSRCHTGYSAGQHRCNRCGAFLPVVQWLGHNRYNRPPGIYFYKDKFDVNAPVGRSFKTPERRAFERRYMDRPGYPYNW